MNYTKQQQLKKANIQFLIDYGPTTFITLATNNDGTVENMKRLSKDFFGRFDRKQLGHTWLKGPSKLRTDGFGFIEHKYSNIHAHFAVQLAVGKIEEPAIGLECARIWQKLCERGSLNFQTVTDVEGLAHYVTKELSCPSYDLSTQNFLLGEFFANN